MATSGILAQGLRHAGQAEGDGRGDGRRGPGRVEWRRRPSGFGTAPHGRGRPEERRVDHTGHALAESEESPEEEAPDEPERITYADVADARLALDIEDDPRRAVLICWSRLEDSLVERGVVRSSTETGSELLSRKVTVITPRMTGRRRSSRRTR